MSGGRSFSPDWISAPGETIAAALRERALSLSEFAEQIGTAADDASSLLQGRAPITLAIARRLEEVVGGTVAFWMSRDFQYRERAKKAQQAEKSWLKELPVGDMVRFGWLQPAPNAAEEIDACLAFFDVSSVKEWRQRYVNAQSMAAFKTSPTFDSTVGSLAAWLRRSEIEAKSLSCRHWNAETFRDSLQAIRALTRSKHPSYFLPRLIARCAESGVAVVIVRPPNGCRVSGATWFISPKKAALALTFRHLSDDQFWFSFFHEAGHLILHGIDRQFLEGTGMPADDAEQEADEFAAEQLVPPKFAREMASRYWTSEAVLRFASEVGVSPGIIVGQLQHRGILQFNQLNKLKRRFHWHD